MATSSIKALQTTEYTFSGTTNNYGQLITTIDWDNKIVNAYAKIDNTTYYTWIRPTSANKVVARVMSNTEVMSNQSVTIHVIKLI